MNFYGSTRMQQMLTYLKNYLTEKFNGKQDTLTFDEVPTENSRNPVRSGGIYNALATKIDGSGLATVATTGNYSDLNGKPTIDSALSDSSTNAVQNKVVNTALAGKVNDNDSRLSDARTPVAHTHPASDITGIPSVAWTKIQTATATASSETLPIRYVMPNNPLFTNLATFKNTYKEIMVVLKWQETNSFRYIMSGIMPIEELEDVTFNCIPVSPILDTWGFVYEPVVFIQKFTESEYMIRADKLYYQDDNVYATRTDKFNVTPSGANEFTATFEIFVR